MSKFIDMLHRAGQRAPSPMGFGPVSGRRGAARQLLSAATVMPKDLSDGLELADVEADALLLAEPEEATLDSIASELEGRLWGARRSSLGADEARGLMDRGCDFVVIESTETEASVLNDEDLGTVVTLDTALSQEVIRATGQLPVDAVLFSPALRALPLTVEKLVEVQRVRGLSGKPFIVEAPLGLGQADLEALSKLGVDGLLVDVPPANRAQELGQMIDNLPRGGPRRVRGDALVPQVYAPDEENLELPDEE